MTTNLHAELDGLAQIATAPPHIVLRMLTSDAHEQLHRIPVFESLASGRLAYPEYRELLGRLLGFHEPIERAIAAQLGDSAFSLDIAAMRRSRLLHEDLEDCGLSRAQIEALPRLEARVPASPAAALGIVYVVEGSTLGGLQLSRAMTRGQVEVDAIPQRFLRAAADPSRPTWRAVRASIDACGAEKDRLAAMIAAAVATFAAFGSWFEPVPAVRPIHAMPAA